MSDRQQLLEDARYVRNLERDNEAQAKTIADLGIGLHTLKTQNAALVEALRRWARFAEQATGTFTIADVQGIVSDTHSALALAGEE